MRRRRKGGNVAIETAIFIPVLLLLIVGMVQIGKVTYLYYTLKKIVYAAARQVAVQQSINFCDVTQDQTAQSAINFALNDASGTPIVANLTTLQIATQCTDPNNVGGAMVPCDTSNCDALSVAARPDFVTVSIPGGYPVNVRIPFISPIPVTLNPTVTVPFGGVS
jgi:Flp pilus assembly protein TadG